MRDETTRDETLAAYKAVFNASPLGICVWNIEDPTDPGAMKLELVNDGANSVSGTDMRQFLGRSMRDAFPELLETKLPQRYIDVLLSGESTIEELEYGDANIDHKWFHVRVFKVSKHLVAISYDDITREKLAAQELAVTRRKQLERSKQELEQFAYVASHDLQEPLRMVASFTQLLAKQHDDKLDAQAKKYIHFATDGAVRMQALIDGLLSLSRISRSMAPLVPVDLNDVAKRVIAAMRRSKTLENVEVKYESLPTILGDANQLELVFQNLIQNAAKFNRSATPVIAIGTRTHQATVEIFVKDNGIGIEENQHARIFEIFQRLNKRSEFDGSGVGLALVQKIVEHHDGAVEVESAPDKGAIFRLLFPSLTQEV